MNTSTKKERLNKYKNYLNSIGLCASIKTNHPYIYNDMVELFKNHPEYPNKITRMVDLCIKQNTRNSKYYEFNIIKDDGSTEDISYRCCINKRPKNHDLNSAMRSAIEDQIIDFRNSIVNKKCEFCSSCDNIEVDHIYLFKKLCLDFLKNKKDIPNSFDDGKYNQAIFKKSDENFENEWKEYHKINSFLRFLCKKCNASRNKK